MPQILTIQDARNLAVIRDGKCLSKEYINRGTPLKWICKQGHTWDSAYSIIQQGAWCNLCTKNNRWLENVREIAEKKGGCCLSDQYIKNRAELKFKCSKSHKFLLTYASLTRGAWCSLCRKKELKDKELNRFKILAEKKGGLCLSTNYENKFSTLKFQCKKGHTWSVGATGISSGRWCAECSREDTCSKELQKLNTMAEKKGGKCLSTTFSRTDVKLKWQCKEGHIFNAMPKSIRKGTWCRKCSGKIIAEKVRKYTIDQLQKLAAKKGGRVLSKEFLSITKHLKWQCKEGHIWMAVPTSIIHAGRWCNICYIDSLRSPIETFHKIAKEHKGKLLSDKYINNHTAMKWQCAKGHVWLARPGLVKKGFWCLLCSEENKKKLRLEVFRKLAKKNKGELLSVKYLGIETKLKWKCDKGHTWMTTPHLIKSGTWCPTCAKVIQRQYFNI